MLETQPREFLGKEKQVDTQNITQDAVERKHDRKVGFEIAPSAALASSYFHGPNRSTNLSPSDTRIVLRSGLRLLANRIDSGIAVRVQDVQRLERYADDGREAA